MRRIAAVLAELLAAGSAHAGVGGRIVRSVGFPHESDASANPTSDPAPALAAPASAQVADWPATEGAPGGGRYSPLDDVTPANVARLEVAWTYRHGDFWAGSFPLPVNRGSGSYWSLWPAFLP